MAGQVEEVCPLCMEKMDSTDHELQPCMCGYEVCLWCWHSINQAALMDGSDAQCPACRNPYDKDKILKRTVSKERLATLNTSKKEKLQKTKQRVPDSGKNLNTVRVIQRNIVYMAGISISLANDKTLRKKEYLGQYGRIVKMVIAQTDGSRQYYSSNTCIVKLQQCSGLGFNSLKQRSGSSLPPPLSSKNSLPPSVLINNNRNGQSDEFGRSYASVAASHTRSKLPSMKSCLITPSSGTEVHILANAWDDDQISNAICTSKNEGPLSKGNVENFAHAMPFAEMNYPEQNYMPDYNTANSNMLTKDGENIPKEFFSAQDDFVTVSSNYDFSNIQELSGDSTSSLHNILPLDDWFRLHSDLESQKLSCSFANECLSSPNNRESKCFNALPTITTTLCHKLDKPSPHFPAEPMLCNLEQKNLCGKSSSYNGFDFEFSQSYTIRDKRSLQIGAINDTSFLDRSNMYFHGSSTLTNTMHVDHCKDRILSEFFALDHDEIDDPADSHCVEQFCDFDDLSRLSKPWLPSTRVLSKSSFSMMDCNYAASGHFSLWPISASPLPGIMVKHKDYREDSSNVFNSNTLLSTVEAADNSENSLFMHNSGFPLYQAVSQRPYSGSSQKSTLSSPVLSPKNSTQGSKYLPHNLLYSGYSSNLKNGRHSLADPRHSDSVKIASTAKGILQSLSAVSHHSCESSNLDVASTAGRMECRGYQD